MDRVIFDKLYDKFLENRRKKPTTIEIGANARWICYEFIDWANPVMNELNLKLLGVIVGEKKQSMAVNQHCPILGANKISVTGEGISNKNGTVEVEDKSIIDHCTKCWLPVCWYDIPNRTGARDLYNDCYHVEKETQRLIGEVEARCVPERVETKKPLLRDRPKKQKTVR